MIHLKNFLNKREQSQARLSFAKREKSRLLAKSLLTLVALLAVTTGAWADETPLLTIESKDYTTFKSGSMTFDDMVTVTFSNSVYNYGNNLGWFTGSTASLLTVAGINGYTITSCKFYTENGDAANGYTVQGESPSVYLYNANVFTDDSQSEYIGYSGVTKIEVYGTAPVASSATAVDIAWDAAKKTGTFTQPAGNVELQVEYYPGMLVKPTNLVGGTMEIEGLTDTTLPEGFEKDDEGNIYVAKDTKFTVKAVPAEGYHLVGWSDDAENKELEREFTMGDDDFILTATFSDEYDLAFNALNANTIEDGKATVKVGDTDKTATLIQDGKLSMKSGQTVTLTAATGYKFRKAEVTKGISTLKSLKIGNYTVYYAEGETWYQALMRDENNNCGLETSVGYVFNYAEEPLLDSGGNNVSEGSVIDPSKGYHFAD